MLVAFFRVQPIVATLVLMVAGRGVAQLITEGKIMTFLNEGLIHLGAGTIAGVPTPVVIWIIMGALVTLGVRRTALGMLIEAIGINETASRLAGINSRVLLVTVYLTSGFCAALAGVIVAADIKGADANNAGLWMELDAILAVVIGGNSLLGGRFSIIASLLGALIIQSVNSVILLGHATGIQPGDQGVDHHRYPGDPVADGETQPVPAPGQGQFDRVGRTGHGRQGPPREGDPVMMRSPRLALYITMATFVLAYLVSGWQYPAMFSSRVVANLLTDNAFLGLTAVGMTFVILSGGIDLSVGSVIAFSGVFLAVILRDTSLHPLVAFVLLLAITTAFGAAMGSIIHYLEMPPFIVTLAGMFLMRGLAYVLSTDSVPITHPFYDTIQDVVWKAPGGGRFRLIGGIMLLAYIAALIVLHRTRFGRNVYALGGSVATARLMGVPIARTTIAIYAIGGGLAGLAGIVYSIYTSAGYSLATVGVGSRRHRRGRHRRHAAHRRLGLRGGDFLWHPHHGSDTDLHRV
ncbi:MAG: hypothetical protein R3D80_09040 [Paracoccaceae bacterium]